MRDILDTAAARFPGMYEHLRVRLIERSAAARDAQRATLAGHAARLAGVADDLPDRITGVVLANELLDAMPVHVVVQRAGGLREVRVGERDGLLHEVEGPPSTPRLAEHLARAGASLQDGWRVEVGLAGCDWTRRAAESITRGFLLLFDYGHPARELYSASHAAGTLTAYRGHVAGGRDWLTDPGRADLTCHVDLTSIELAARDGGMANVGLIDQTYFLANLGMVDRLALESDHGSLGRRLAAKTLLMPGGLGSTIKVMCFAKGTGPRRLRGFSSGRLT
jgi:SAM-dependent MidA family methyltransferase